MSTADVVARVVGSLVFYFLPAIPFIILERRSPSRPISYRTVVPRDMRAWAAVAVLGGVSAILVELLFGTTFGTPATSGGMASLLSLSSWTLFLLAWVASDFTLYWLHRALHTRSGWPTHRWHHSPTYMYWFAGVRQSFVQGFVYGLPFAWFYVLGVPVYLFPVQLVLQLVTNHWVHTNWDVKAKWMSLVFITPRAHRIHHSKAPQHQGRNFGTALSVWDRLFGTYVDPEAETAPLEFGIDEEPNAIRLAIGL